MRELEFIQGFSKMIKEEKLQVMGKYFQNSEEMIQELKSYWYHDPARQKIFDEFSENTISNYYFPFGIAPNFLINNKMYLIPMVIEESSVVAAASRSAKFWAERGGFYAEVISTTKIGQVHFLWNGPYKKLKSFMPELKEEMFMATMEITANMRQRGGGILDIELVDKTSEIDNYYQIKASFDTADSMGANFINSCLEEFATVLKKFLKKKDLCDDSEKSCDIIMAILSNYTPECLVRSYVECDIKDLGNPEGYSTERFVWKFQKAVEIAQADTYRATTHNKGIFNGIDAVVLATGNDFRAVEACGHTYASRNGKYESLTSLSLDNGRFHYELKIPLAIGTIGGLTSLHPVAKISHQLLANPPAQELMKIAACAGLANNFGALSSLITKGIQIGHMKMHLLNILNSLNATHLEKKKAIEYFTDKKVSYNAVTSFLTEVRNGQ